LNKKYEGGLSDYFQILEKFRFGQPDEAIASIKTWLAANTATKKYAGDWSFRDTITFLNTLPKSKERDSMIDFCTVLQGELPPPTALSNIVGRGL